MKDLAIVSACSKACKQQVQLYLQQNMNILPHAVKQVSLAQQPHRSVKWLCSMAGLPAIETQREALVSMANVSPEAAAHLLDAGLQISYAQLVSAARQRVPGVEVWVRSHFSGLPTVVEAVCTHNVVSTMLPLTLLQGAHEHAVKWNLLPAICALHASKLYSHTRQHRYRHMLTILMTPASPVLLYRPASSKSCLLQEVVCLCCRLS